MRTARLGGVRLLTAWARFDDLIAGTGTVFGRPHLELIAHDPADVRPVLAQVQAETDAGAWAFGFVSYEAAAGFGLPTRRRDPADPPLVWFGVGGPPTTAPVLRPPRALGPRTVWRPRWTSAEHARGVAAIRQQIAAGETYQCNLTVRLDGHLAEDPLDLYAAMASGQHGAHAAYLDLGRFVLASASPELFFCWHADRLLTRPMKGTARRGRTNVEDARRRAELLASPKERAENVMIVDLLRNDLGRIAVTGTVDVPHLARPERFGTVWQLTSDVTAQVRPEIGLPEIFAALFPSGSVTGVPKHRTMQLITELEDTPRGAYCGAIGVIGPPTAAVRARFSVAIRTVTLDRASGQAGYGTGGGITWSSDAAAEQAELLAKTAVLTEPVEDVALVETMAYVPGRGVRHLAQHLARLADSAHYFGFPVAADLRRQLDNAVVGSTAARVRLELRRDGTVTIELSALPRLAPRPMRLSVDAEPVDSTSRWLFHKTTRRDVYTSRARRHPDAHDVILVNERGEPTETTIASLAVRLEDRWWTPPVESGCLPGVARGILLDRGVLTERVLSVADLRAARDLATVSSLRGWRRGFIDPPSG